MAEVAARDRPANGITPIGQGRFELTFDETVEALTSPMKTLRSIQRGLMFGYPECCAIVYGAETPLPLNLIRPNHGETEHVPCWDCWEGQS